MNNYSYQIMRAVRKYHQIKQIDFAPIIDTSQSALSKIEAGHLELSASQWLTICQKFTLDPRCLFTGKIENLGGRKVKVENHKEVGGFQVPDQYSFLMGSTVRTAYPLLKFMRMKLGDKRTSTYIKSTGFDPDYFLIMNNPLSLAFIQHLVHFMLAEGLFNLSNVQSILDLGQFNDVHSLIIDDLSSIKSLELATKKLLTKVKTSYEHNTSYEFVGGKEFVEAKDQIFVKDFKLSTEFQTFRQKYNLSHFNGLDKLISGEGNGFKVKETSEGWVILKAS
ncbi:MAG TPA: helix-turn-helix transcriptional regulator [Bacteriovoracaceae bacterium]|nr:helix-turn-helix transcriptional regulator [Bacteriovoracaceae bacterium]